MKSQLEQRREQLFTRRDKHVEWIRPLYRRFNPDDIKWLWVAARRAGVQMSQEDFMEVVRNTVRNSDREWILEDRNAEFASGWGPVGLILSSFDGWTLAPHVEWFPWTTKRNKLRCSVAFLQAMRGSSEIGSIKVFTYGEKNQKWFNGLRKYILIHPVGTIPAGRAEGDEYIFHIRGRKHYGRSSRFDSGRVGGRFSGRKQKGDGRIRERGDESVVPTLESGGDTTHAASTSPDIDGKVNNHDSESYRPPTAIH